MIIIINHSYFIVCLYVHSLSICMTDCYVCTYVGMVSKVDDILRMDLADDDGDAVAISDTRYAIADPYQQYPGNGGESTPAIISSMDNNGSRHKDKSSGRVSKDTTRESGRGMDSYQDQPPVADRRKTKKSQSYDERDKLNMSNNSNSNTIRSAPSYDHDDHLAFSNVSNRSRSGGRSKNMNDRVEMTDMTDMDDDYTGGIAANMSKINMYDSGSYSSNGIRRK